MITKLLFAPLVVVASFCSPAPTPPVDTVPECNANFPCDTVPECNANFPCDTNDGMLP